MVLWSSQFARLLSNVTLFETLRLMTKVRSFKLVFLLHRFDHSSRKGQRLEEMLGSAIAEGLFDFLDFPPAIRFERILKVKVTPSVDWMPRVLRYPSYPYSLPSAV